MFALRDFNSIFGFLLFKLFFIIYSKSNRMSRLNLQLVRKWMRFQSSLSETVGSYPPGPRYLGESDGGLRGRLGGEAH